MKTITVQRNNGRTLIMEAESYQLLKSARLDYEADCQGMAECGEQLSSEFRDYVDTDKLRSFDKGTEMVEGKDYDRAESRLRKYEAFYGLD